MVYGITLQGHSRFMCNICDEGYNSEKDAEECEIDCDRLAKHDVIPFGGGDDIHGGY